MKGIKLSRKAWILIGGGVILLASFVFSDGVRQTISRRRSIREAESQLSQLTREADETRDKIKSLETDPQAYEHLVRKELGYMKPGEKEARFLHK